MGGRLQQHAAGWDMTFSAHRMVTKSDLAELRTELKRDIAAVQSTLDDHTQILNNHTRRLNSIENDVKTNLDKRLQLEVRTDRIEKHLGIPKKMAA